MPLILLFFEVLYWRCLAAWAAIELIAGVRIYFRIRFETLKAKSSVRPSTVGVDTNSSVRQSVASLGSISIIPIL